MISYPVGAISSFAFDTAGRLTHSVSTTSSFDAGGVIGMPPLAPTDPDFGVHAIDVPGFAVTSTVTVDTTYDAENHTLSRHPVMVRKHTRPGNTDYGSTTWDQGTWTLGWGPNGHPTVLQMGQNATVPYLTLHWDGDIILFITDASGNVLEFKAGLDGEITPRASSQPALMAYERDAAGVII